jgi:hypothetical protein
VDHPPTSANYAGQMVGGQRKSLLRSARRLLREIRERTN